MLSFFDTIRSSHAATNCPLQLTERFRLQCESMSKKAKQTEHTDSSPKDKRSLASDCESDSEVSDSEENNTKDNNQHNLESKTEEGDNEKGYTFSTPDPVEKEKEKQRREQQIQEDHVEELRKNKVFQTPWRILIGFGSLGLVILIAGVLLVVFIDNNTPTLVHLYRLGISCCLLGPLFTIGVAILTYKKLRAINAYEQAHKQQIVLV